MTDGRTTEQTAMEQFRMLLEKRGIEYETDDDECADGEERTTTFKASLGDEIYVTAKEWYCGGELTPWLDVEFHNALTPEQAIAATLGNTKYVYALCGTDPSTMPSYGGETNELLGIYATRKAAEKAKAEWRDYCDLDITECEVMGR
jgi:hypothetical protein